MKTIKTILFLAVGFVFLLSCKTETKTTTTNQDAGSQAVETHGQAGVVDNVSAANALQVAQSLDDFSTLVTAIEKAGVENSVVNAGPLTIFAPTNEAFDKVPQDVLQDLLKPENKAQLSNVLTNHVAPSNYPIEQLEKEASKGRKLYMASGEYLVVENKDGKIYVGGTPVLKSVKVSNGWIHVINDVLVP